MTPLVPEEILRLFADEAVDYAIILFDREARVQHWNTGAQRMFGYTPEEAAGRSGHFIFAPEDVAAGVPEEELATAGRDGHASDRRWKVRRNGSRFFGEGLMTALRRNDGELLGYAKIIRDATDEKLHEEERDAERRRAGQLSSLQSGVTIILRDAATFEEAIPEILRHVARTLGWDFAAFWEVDARANLLRRWSAWSAVDTPSSFSDAATLAMGEGLPGRVRAAKRAVWLEDIGGQKESEFPRRASALAAGFASAMAFPVVLSGEVLGIVELFSRTRAPEAPEIVASMELAGAQIGLFIERRRAELAVRDSEARYRAVAETATDAILTIDANSTILYANPAVERLLGYSRSELVGASMSMIIPERLRQAHARGMARYIQTGSKRVPWDGIELPVLCRDGSEVPTEVRFGEYVEGDRRLFTGYIRDIRERKRADQEKSELLRAAQEARGHAEEISRRLERLVGITDVVLAHLSVDEMLGTFMTELCSAVECDTSAVLLLGEGDRLTIRAASGLSYGPDEGVYLGEGFAGRVAQTREPVILDEDHEDVQPVIPALQRAGLRAMLGVPLTTAGGVIGVLVVGSVQPRRYSEDDLRVMKLVAQRVAIGIEQVRLFEAERAARERATFVSEATHLLAETIDYEETMCRIARVAVPRIADWCAVDLLVDGENSLKRVAVEHVDPEKVRLARRLQERYPPDLSGSGGAAQAVRERRTLYYRDITAEMLRAATHDDEHMALLRDLGLRSAIVVPLIAADRVLGVMTFVTAGQRLLTQDDVTIAQDVAARASVAIQNAELYREAQDANRAKDDFLATVSHELRTPMTAVLGWARLLRYETDPELVAEAAMAIERSATAQAKLIEDILDIARIRVGKLRMRLESASLAEVVEAAADTVRLTAEARQITLTVEIDRTIPPVRGDAQRLQQVVWNLLSNAVKFTPERGSVSVTLTRAGSRAVLTVSDTGPGIPSDFLPHLFERFRQAESMQRRSHGGLGLGLSLARYIVDAHGGTIRVRSEEGKGATFVVELPMTPAETARAERGGRRASDPMASLEGVAVLVVEDDREAMQFLARVLERAGAEVRAVASAAEALREVAERVPDVVLSDIAMPGQSGYDLLKALRASRHGASVPVVAVTASGTSGDRERALSAGFDEYLRKPVDPHALVELVRSVADAA